MRKSLFVIIGGVIFIVLVAWFFIVQKSETKLPLIQNSEVSVYIAKRPLMENQSTLIIENTLRPDIEIAYLDKWKIQKVVIDQKLDVLTRTPLLDGITIKDTKGNLKVTLPFLLDPGPHNISVTAVTDDSKERIYTYAFSLGIRNTFDGNLSESQFFLIPDGTPRDIWYVSNGKLSANSPKEGHPSLAFFYRFSDVFASFDLIPKGDVINLVFYFLESGRSIVIGNGNNSRVTLLQGPPRPGEPVSNIGPKMKAGSVYSVFISRKNNSYAVYIFEGGTEENAKKISNTEPTLKFVDSEYISGKEDSLGFAVWPGSSSFEIDNLTVSSGGFINQ